MTSNRVQVDGPKPAGKASIAAVDLEMRVDERLVGTETNISWVGNLEGADQWGYVPPRFWTDPVLLPQV